MVGCPCWRIASTKSGFAPRTITKQSLLQTGQETLTIDLSTKAARTGVRAALRRLARNPLTATSLRVQARRRALRGRLHATRRGGGQTDKIRQCCWRRLRSARRTCSALSSEASQGIGVAALLALILLGESGNVESGGFAQRPGSTGSGGKPGADPDEATYIADQGHARADWQAAAFQGDLRSADYRVIAFRA